MHSQQGANNNTQVVFSSVTTLVEIGFVFFGGPPQAQFGHIIITYYVKVKIVGPI
jgi:hypothetical protein